MFAFVVLAATVYPDDYSGICLSDAKRFAWIEKTIVCRNYEWSRDHWQKMLPVILLNNSPSDCEAWLIETTWRRKCWDKLDDVIVRDFATPKKTQSLAELRALLGHADYYAGRMPWPIPNYRVRE